MQEYIMHPENATVLVKCDLGIMDLSAFVRGGDKIFGAVLDPFDGAVQLHRRPWDEHFLLIEHHDLRTESTANERRDDAHVPLRQIKHVCQAVTDHNWSL